jgi:hypothetical protein
LHHLVAQCLVFFNLALDAFAISLQRSPQTCKLANETINLARRTFGYLAQQLAEIFGRHLDFVSLNGFVLRGIGMVLVAAAGPLMNLGLAVAAALAFHLVIYLPTIAAQWAALNLKNALIINVVLAIFNLFPLPPLDGGRIIVGLLPNALAKQFARLEPYGLMILIGLLFIVPLLGSQLGINLNLVSYLILVATNAVLRTILRLTGNA